MGVWKAINDLGGAGINLTGMAGSASGFASSALSLMGSKEKSGVAGLTGSALGTLGSVGNLIQSGGKAIKTGYDSYKGKKSKESKFNTYGKVLTDLAGLGTSAVNLTAAGLGMAGNKKASGIMKILGGGMSVAGGTADMLLSSIGMHRTKKKLQRELIEAYGTDEQKSRAKKSWYKRRNVVKEIMENEADNENASKMISGLKGFSAKRDKALILKGLGLANKGLGAMGSIAGGIGMLKGVKSAKLSKEAEITGNKDTEKLANQLKSQSEKWGKRAGYIGLGSSSAGFVLSGIGLAGNARGLGEDAYDAKNYVGKKMGGVHLKDFLKRKLGIGQEGNGNDEIPDDTDDQPQNEVNDQPQNEVNDQPQNEENDQPQNEDNNNEDDEIVNYERDNEDTEDTEDTKDTEDLKNDDDDSSEIVDYDEFMKENDDSKEK